MYGVIAWLEASVSTAPGFVFTLSKAVCEVTAPQGTPDTITLYTLPFIAVVRPVTGNELVVAPGTFTNGPPFTLTCH